MKQFELFSQTDYPHQYNLLMNKLPWDVYNLCKEYHLVLCGGALTSVFSGRPISDFDLYPTSKYSKYDEKELKDKLEKLSNSTFKTDNAISYVIKGVKIQLITKDLGIELPDKKPSLDPFGIDRSSLLVMTQILSKFDFTICMAGFDFNTNTFALYNNFLLDLSTRKLVFNPNTQYPISSNYRVLKYIKKGFILPAGESIKIALAINNLHIETYQDLKEQLMGIDTLVFEQITNDLINKHGETAKVDYGVVMDLIEHSLNKIWKNPEESNTNQDDEPDWWD